MTSGTITELAVSGMTCNNCARKVTEALQKLPGVHSVSVNVSAERASLRWISAKQKDIPAALSAVAQAGFVGCVITDGNAPTSHWHWPLLVSLTVTACLMVGQWGLQLAETPWFQWLSFILGTGVQVFCGAPFYRGAWRQIKVGQSNMDALVALGSTTAFGYSAWALCSGAGGHVFFLEAVAIISLISAGHWLEARVSAKASQALQALLQLAPATARKIEAPTGEPLNLKKLSFSRASSAVATEAEVPVATLKPGDRIALRPGDQVPVDGQVLSGESAVDEAMLTGESIPADKRAGSELFAGTVNINGRLVMRVTATGEATALSHIIATVQRAQTSRADIQRLGDRISSVFVPVIVGIALTSGLAWGFAFASVWPIHEWLSSWLGHSYVTAGAATAFMIAAAVLIVACPCAMGLATPAAIMAAANAASRCGILIRDGVALEKAGKITAIVLDKTGTLTRGQLVLTGSWTPSQDPDSTHLVQKLAGAMAKPSSHPASKALAGFSIEAVNLENWRETPGSGVEAGWVSGKATRERLRLGSLPWLRQGGVNIPEGEAMIERWQTEGASLIGLAQGEVLLGIFALKDVLKNGAVKVVGKLQQQGYKTYLLTGDSPQTAVAIAQQVHIAAENVFAGVHPEQKAEFIQRLQARGERVAFVGDGINDAPALTQADLGIAVSRASDVARAAADIILLKSEIESVPLALGLARATLRTIKQNLFWAFFYNALGVPLAALGFINPIFCAAAMGVSDLIVIGNALRLLRWRDRS